MSVILQNLKTQLSQNNIPPLYFIIGPERFLIKQILHTIKTNFLSEDTFDFNYEVFFANKMDTVCLRESVETLPVLATKRIIICEEAQALTSAQLLILLPILKKTIDTSILVFVSEAPDKRKKPMKDLISLCTVILAETPKDQQWVDWLKWMGKTQGISFSDSAITLLKEYAGYDLINLETEIKKIKNFIGSKTHISKQDVLAVVPRICPENIFALSKAIGEKKLSSALLCLARILEDNHNEIGALSLISRHIRILSRVKEGIKKGYTEQTLCHKTGVSRFFIRNYIKEANLWTEQKIVFSIEMLKATDKALKFSSVSSHIWLENFIIQACIA